ncbi:hypothetical protein TYRP_023767, partial [Tyrophagus putrescentiae]
MSRGGAYRSEARVLHERLAIECLALAKAETVRHLFNVSLRIQRQALLSGLTSVFVDLQLLHAWTPFSPPPPITSTSPPGNGQAAINNNNGDNDGNANSAPPSWGHRLYYSN